MNSSSSRFLHLIHSSLFNHPCFLFYIWVIPSSGLQRIGQNRQLITVPVKLRSLPHRAVRVLFTVAPRAHEGRGRDYDRLTYSNENSSSGNSNPKNRQKLIFEFNRNSNIRRKPISEFIWISNIRQRYNFELIRDSNIREKPTFELIRNSSRFSLE